MKDCKCANCKSEILPGMIYYQKGGKKYCEKCDFGGKGHVRVVKDRR